MIEIIPFQAQHAYQITKVPITSNFIKIMQRYETDANGMTVLYDGEIFMCGGVVSEAGNGTVWTVNSDLVHKHPFTFHRIMKNWKDLFMEMYNLNRIQAFVDATNTGHIKWIESLKFTREALMRKFYEGRDFYLYASIRGE